MSSTSFPQSVPAPEQPSYLSAAFQWQYNLILLGGSAAFALASASKLPLLVGLGAEVVWLAIVPRLAAFRRHVVAAGDAERRARLDGEVQHNLRDLSPQHAERARVVSRNIALVVEQLGLAGDVAERAVRADFEQLGLGFVRLCRLEQRLATRLDEMRASPPEEELHELSRAYASEKDLGARFTLHQGIKLAQRKIEQQSRVFELRRQVELKLSLIEQSLTHLRHEQQLGVASAVLLRDMQSAAVHASAADSIEAELATA